MPSPRRPEKPLFVICEWLEAIGLAEFVACFDPLRIQPHRWEERKHALPDVLIAPCELFLFGRAAAVEAFPPELRDAVLALVESGLARLGPGGAVELNELLLLPVLGLWLLSPKPSANPTLYFGDDSLALAARLRARPQARALDLCAGLGVQALRLAQCGAHVTAVELNPDAAELGRLNAAINGLGEHVAFRVGVLCEPVGGERFDVVCANPPFVPVPDDLPFPLVGNGGPDGLKIVRRILDGLPLILPAKGFCRLLGTPLSDGRKPLCADELKAWARQHAMNIVMTITSHHSLGEGSAVFAAIAGTAAATGGIAPEQARAHLRRHLEAVQASHLCFYFLHVRRGQGDLRIIDVSAAPPRGFWFAD